MVPGMDMPLITTRPEFCRACYTCVRECPAKAIRIAEGQAQVLPDRCIACGNCVQVCSQRAKQVASSVGFVTGLLQSGARLAACLAPSFPAEFPFADPARVAGMIKALGFAYVHDVGFGADLVSLRYRHLVENAQGHRYVATNCPAIVGYVKRYHPELVSALAPLVSPMIAMARVARTLHGPDVGIVFIGPCIAKKAEAADPDLPREVDAVLTFAELQQMLLVGGIKPESVAPVDFDPPIGGLGGLFPLNRGMLQAASIHEDLITGDVISAEGRAHFVEAIKDFEDENLDVSLLEVLCCNGCIMGAGMTTHASLFNRRARVSQSVRRRMTSFDKAQWWGHMERFAGLDLSRTYSAFDQRIAPPSFAKLSEIMARMGKHGPEDELNCGACGYDTCREHAIAIFKGLAEIEMCLPFAIEKLRSTVKDLAVSNQQLAETQEALMQSEKLASMGQLAAGIAHELNNPLGVVLMYAHLMLDEHERDPKVREDLQMISDQADRCKKIVAGLLHFARQNKVDLEPADLREWVAGALRLNPAPENVSVRVEHCEADSTVEADASQMLQVLANLIWNAYAAMPDGGELSIQTNGDAEWVRIAIADTGVGIPKENMAKVFEPFFTTKENGKGTGLGLAVSYGIVKMHRGSIDVISNSDPQIGPTGSTFVVKLPRHVVSEPPSEKAESLLET